jgi:hypothetical protein
MRQRTTADPGEHHSDQTRLNSLTRKGFTFAVLFPVLDMSTGILYSQLGKGAKTLSWPNTYLTNTTGKS